MNKRNNKQLYNNTVYLNQVECEKIDIGKSTNAIKKSQIHHNNDYHFATHSSRIQNLSFRTIACYSNRMPKMIDQ